MGGSIDEAWDQVLQLEAAVEAIAELGEIALQVLGIQHVVRAVQGVLDVAEHGVNPLEHRVRHAGGTTAGDQRHVRAVGGGDAGEAVEAVGDDGRAGRQMELRPLRQRGLAEARHHVHAHVPWENLPQ